MSTEQAQVFMQNMTQYKPLTDNDTLVYEKVNEIIVFV
jgi:hypothetical protein